MKIRRALTAAATLVATIALALAVPVAQLRTFHVDAKCCCPDPDNCHCPPDKKHDGHGPSLDVCHHSANLVIAPQAPSFASPTVTTAIAPVRVTRTAPSTPLGPKADHFADEPYGPS